MTTARLAFTAFAAWMVMLSATPVAQAQFAYRCTEGGKTTYSQAPCQGSDVAVISTRPNSIDASAERAHRARATRRAMNNAILDYVDAQSRFAGNDADQQTATSAPSQRGGQARSPRGPVAVTSAASPQMAPPPPLAPRVMTHCTTGFCYDNQGGVYHRHGNAQTMTGPTGTTCTRAGNMVHCP